MVPSGGVKVVSVMFTSTTARRAKMTNPEQPRMDAPGGEKPNTDDGILVIWSSKDANGRRNLEHGLTTKTWGFRRWHPDYNRNYRWVLFASEHSGRGPRVPAEEWQ